MSSCEMLHWILHFASVLLSSATYGKHTRSVVKAQNVIKAERETRWQCDGQIGGLTGRNNTSAGLDEKGL